MKTMITITRGALAVALGLGVTLAFSQAPEAPKPGPEHMKLDYFVGTWQTDGEMAESPFGPGGRTMSQDSCEWFEGKFALVCRSDGKGPTGPMKGLYVLGYSPEEKVYTFYGVDNSGMAMMSIPRGTIDGQKWTYHDEMKMGDMIIKSRYIIEVLSPESYTFSWQMQGEEGKWNLIASGRSTRRQTTAKD